MTSLFSTRVGAWLVYTFIPYMNTLLKIKATHSEHHVGHAVHDRRG